MDTDRKCRRHQRSNCRVCIDQAEASFKSTDTMINTLFYPLALSDDDINTNHPGDSSSSTTYDSSSYDSSSSDSSSSDSGSFDSGGSDF